MGSFKKNSILCQIFEYSGLGGRSFRCEWFSAQGATAAHFVAPVRERQRKVMPIWLQRNNKYSFDREQPGLILKFWQLCTRATGAIWGSRLGYHSLTGAHFDDVVVFQPVSAMCVIMVPWRCIPELCVTGWCIPWWCVPSPKERQKLFQIVFNLSNIYTVVLNHITE
jgi:hypothetical protein